VAPYRFSSAAAPSIQASSTRGIDGVAPGSIQLGGCAGADAGSIAGSSPGAPPCGVAVLGPMHAAISVGQLCSMHV
jgi:hypothetical protein